MKVSVVDHLDNIRKHLGEDAWKAEVTKLALQALKMGGVHETFWRDLLSGPDYSWANADELKKAADAIPGSGAPDINQLMAQALKQTMPGLKSQAQFNAFRAAFDAFRAVSTAILDLDKLRRTRHASFSTWLSWRCIKPQDVTRKLEDVPEAASSAAANDFKQPPAEFMEYDVLQALLSELGKIERLEALESWYKETKDRRDCIRSQMLRNTLIDAVRAKKLELAGVPNGSRSNRHESVHLHHPHHTGALFWRGHGHHVLPMRVRAFCVHERGRGPGS